VTVVKPHCNTKVRNNYLYIRAVILAINLVNQSMKIFCLLIFLC